MADLIDLAPEAVRYILYGVVVYVWVVALERMFGGGDG